MFRPVGLIALLVLCIVPPAIAQSAPPQPASPKSDQSQEGIVIEAYSRKEKFENDGTSSAENTARIRIQSEAGVQQYGVLTFAYASGTGTIDILYVRVRKPDGSLVETPQDSMQDMAAPITREGGWPTSLFLNNTNRGIVIPHDHPSLHRVPGAPLFRALCERVGAFPNLLSANHRPWRSVPLR